MNRFADLLDRLVYTSSRNAKIKLLVDYFRATPDPDRGIALAALTSSLDLKQAKAGRVRALIEEHIDPELFRLSYDYVGDTAETVALLWPDGTRQDLQLGQLIEEIRPLKGKQVEAKIADCLDTLDSTGRWAFLKLLTGGMRVGVSARLAKMALAELGKVEVGEIEELWHALEPPYGDLFAWLCDGQEKPKADALTLFRPLMLAHPLDDKDREALNWADHCIEWKWDGARVQLSGDGDSVALYSRSGDSLIKAFPEFQGLKFQGVLDGELMAYDETGQLSFNALQQRLNRKTVSKKLMEQHPTRIRLYDCLFEAETDIRQQPLRERKLALARMQASLNDPRIDVSTVIEETDAEKIAALREANEDPVIEGFMIKRWESAYEAGRPKGLWYKWKRDPYLVDAVLLYAQRGHGKRSSYYSDYTFGALSTNEDGEPWVVPIGKAYSGMDDEEMKRIDKYVKENTVDRFGPVRAVTPGLVFEVAFEGIQESKRHKSGIALRFPRIHRIRWDKAWLEADTLETVKSLLGRPKD